MSHVRFNISDRDGSVSGDLHGSMTTPLIAALTAEPETIAEFESALHRFIKSESDWPPLHGFLESTKISSHTTPGSSRSISRAARSVIETTYTIPHSEGNVRVPSEFADDDDDVYIPYRLPDDWTFVDRSRVSKACADRNREAASEASRIRRASDPFRPAVDQAHRYVHRECASDLETQNLFGRHPRGVADDKTYRSPRSNAARNTFRETRLHRFRSSHAFAAVVVYESLPAAALAKDSFAYINAGFGTHEWVLYYDMIRHLLADAATRREAGDGCGHRIRDRSAVA